MHILNYGLSLINLTLTVLGDGGDDGGGAWQQLFCGIRCLQHRFISGPGSRQTDSLLDQYRRERAWNQSTRGNDLGIENRIYRGKKATPGFLALLC